MYLSLVLASRVYPRSQRFGWKGEAAYNIEIKEGTEPAGAPGL